MKTVKIAEFLENLKGQEVPREHLAFVCPMCKTVQSMADLIAAGVKSEDADRYIGFSCVGRWTSGKPPRKTPDGKPCNWTLGGLFHLHELEIETEDGKKHPHFEPATKEQAQAHMKGPL